MDLKVDTGRTTTPSTPTTMDTKLDLQTELSLDHILTSAGIPHHERAVAQDMLKRLMMGKDRHPTCSLDDQRKTTRSSTLDDHLQLDLHELFSSTTARVLYFISMGLFRAYAFHEHGLDLDYPTLVEFLQHVEQQGYALDLPYHNATHAADVMLNLHHLIQLIDHRPKKNFSPVQLLAALLSAVLHDVGHVGLTNDCLVQMNSDLTQEFGPTSTLEHLHVSRALDILDRFDFLSRCQPHDQAEVRRLVKFMILMTDIRVVTSSSAAVLSNHSVLFAAHDDDDSNNNNNCHLSSGDDTPHRQEQVLAQLVHAADIGAGAKGFATHERWTARITAEFYSQGDIQRALGLEVSPGCDRFGTKAAGMLTLATSQIGFLCHVVRPMYEKLEHLEPRVGPYVTEIDRNIDMWTTKRDQNSVESSHVR